MYANRATVHDDEHHRTGVGRDERRDSPEVPTPSGQDHNVESLEEGEHCLVV